MLKSGGCVGYDNDILEYCVTTPISLSSHCGHSTEFPAMTKLTSFVPFATFRLRKEETVR